MIRLSYGFTNSNKIILISINLGTNLSISANAYIYQWYWGIGNWNHLTSTLHIHANKTDSTITITSADVISHTVAYPIYTCALSLAHECPSFSYLQQTHKERDPGKKNVWQTYFSMIVIRKNELMLLLASADANYIS